MIWAVAYFLMAVFVMAAGPARAGCRGHWDDVDLLLLVCGLFWPLLGLFAVVFKIAQSFERRRPAPERHPDRVFPEA